MYVAFSKPELYENSELEFYLWIFFFCYCVYYDPVGIHYFGGRENAIWQVQTRKMHNGISDGDY